MLEKIFQKFMEVRSISTDTRRIIPGSVFFALKGDRFNGNFFALTALEQGASMAVVDEDLQSADERIVRVDDVLLTLQQLALKYRKTFGIPFLAITGSNGKTTTKELTRDVLNKKFRVHATAGNLNNHIGVPLTLLSMPADCEFAIIEMGANHQGEIRSYCTFSEPGFALITNMGKAHLEGFGGEEGVRKGKKELYDFVHAHGGKLFVNIELSNLEEASRGMDRIEYGFRSGDFNLEIVSESPVVRYRYAEAGKSAVYTTHLAGAYNLYNIASAIAVGRYFGVGTDLIHEAITTYSPDNNRSQLTKTDHNLLIMDAYNANPSSMEHALISLSKQEVSNKFFVIGDMRELGEASVNEHRAVLDLATRLGLKGITIGHYYKDLEHEYAFPSFESNDDAREYLRELELDDTLILIKGSRGIKLEEVITVL